MTYEHQVDLIFTVKSKHKDPDAMDPQDILVQVVNQIVDILKNDQLKYGYTRSYTNPNPDKLN